MIRIKFYFCAQAKLQWSLVMCHNFITQIIMCTTLEFGANPRYEKSSTKRPRSVRITSCTRHLQKEI
jgi:hypothetical protein